VSLPYFGDAAPELGDEMAADVIAAFKRISSSSQADKGVIMTVEQLFEDGPRCRDGLGAGEPCNI
jgi:hypothetical protein